MVKQISSLSEIRESVNPVFKTARSCVIVNALLGDEEAQRLMGALGFDIPSLDLDEEKSLLRRNAPVCRKKGKYRKKRSLILAKY